MPPSGGPTMLQFELLDPAARPRAEPLAVTIGRQIASRLADGCHLTRSAVSALLADETGVESWGTAWSIDDFNDAIEIGALLWLRSHGWIGLDIAVHEAAARFEWLDAALPPRHVRSEAQVELQQFSTPPMLSWLMTRAAQLRASDAVLEPSAGNGALALWPTMHGCDLFLNEIDPDRQVYLAHLFPEAAVTSHDGELIDHLLGHCPPTGILMNPPFARSRERGVSSATALRHLRSALRLSRNGARLVAIMPDGFDGSRFACSLPDVTLRLDTRIAGAFRTSGTGIPVRMVVFDKIADGPPAATTESHDLTELASLIDRLPPRARGTSTAPVVSVRPVTSLLATPARIRPSAPFATHPVPSSPFEVLDYAALDDPASVPEQAARATSERSPTQLPTPSSRPISPRAACCRTSSCARPRAASSRSKQVLDELAMQRRDVLAIHLANDPGLALDVMIFTLADADGHDWRARKAITIAGPAANGPVSGFEAKDAPASAALAEFTGSLDESWRAGATEVERFAAFRALPDETRSLWLGFVIARTLIASLNTDGERGLPLHDALGGLLEIEIAHWWRPTAANFFDRVPKARILDAFDAVGGPELVSRYAGSKKADLASAAERIFSGEFIGEADVKQQALAWVPAIMRFGSPKEEAIGDDEAAARSGGADDELTEKAA
ncbi:hypothetical protein ACWPMX_11815 [Tsuneonella sp. HG094]